jgi:hypothetical protein
LICWGCAGFGVDRISWSPGFLSHGSWAGARCEVLSPPAQNDTWLCAGGGDWGGVVAFDLGSALEGAQDLVTAGDNLVALLQSAKNLDVGGSGDAGGDGNEFGAEVSVVGDEDVDALDDSRLDVGRGLGRVCRRWLALVGEERLFEGGIALDEGLDGDGEGVGAVGDGDAGGGGEAGAEVAEVVFGYSVQGNDDLEVLCLFGAGCGLGGGDAGGAEEGLVADLGDVALEDAVGERVHGDIGGLAHSDVDDVGLIDLDLGGDD